MVVRSLLLIICFSFGSVSLYGQADSTYTLEYLDKSTRFAWLTYGADLNYLTGGSTQQLRNGNLSDTNFDGTLFPRLTIGGIHFWGHADFYVSFALSFLSIQNTPSGISDLRVTHPIETGFRLFPLKLQPGRFSPFVGVSLKRLRFSQESEDLSTENGVPNYGKNISPLQFGLVYTTDRWHLSASSYYNFQNEFEYYISPTEVADVVLDPLSFNISFLRYIDSDKSFRTKSAVRQINKNYETLKRNNLLSAWFIGLGPSSALQTRKSPFLKENYAFLATPIQPQYYRI